MAQACRLVVLLCLSIVLLACGSVVEAKKVDARDGSSLTVASIGSASSSDLVASPSAHASNTAFMNSRNVATLAKMLSEVETGISQQGLDGEFDFQRYVTR